MNSKRFLLTTIATKTGHHFGRNCPVVARAVDGETRMLVVLDGRFLQDGELRGEFAVIEQRLPGVERRVDEMPVFAGMIAPVVEESIGLADPARRDVRAERHLAHVRGAELGVERLVGLRGFRMGLQHLSVGGRRKQQRGRREADQAREERAKLRGRHSSNSSERIPTRRGPTTRVGPRNPRGRLDRIVRDAATSPNTRWCGVMSATSMRFVPTRLTEHGRVLVAPPRTQLAPEPGGRPGRSVRLAETANCNLARSTRSTRSTRRELREPQLQPQKPISHVERTEHCEQRRTDKKEEISVGPPTSAL